MSKRQMLRALVNERLAAAAEEIFLLFERTIAEYEEELCRWRGDRGEENQRKRFVLSPRIELVRGYVQIPPASPGPGPNLEIPKTPWIKEEPEEQNVKQEEEQLLVCVPESSAGCVKTEDSLLLQQRQSEHRQEPQGQNLSTEPHFHSETEGHTEHSTDTDNDDDWETPFSCSAAQMETEADGDHYNQDQPRDRSTNLCPQNTSAPETTVHRGLTSRPEGTEGKKHQCPFCERRFLANNHLQRHIRVHTGERPYSCSICTKTFNQKCNLDSHIRTHTGVKPYCCPICEKPFARKSHLKVHMSTHTSTSPHLTLLQRIQSGDF